MSQVSTTPSDENSSPEPWLIRRVDSSFRLAAAQRLAEASARGDRDAGRRFLSAATSHGVDLQNFWASCDPETGRVREVALGVPGSGRTAMFFTSVPASRDAEVELGQVIGAACGAFREQDEKGRPTICLAQTLLNPGEKAAARAFEQGGFHELARLAYLGRPVPSPSEFDGFTPWQMPDGMTARSVARLGPDQESTNQALVRALSRSYEQTLDCPELCRLRDVTDVLESHRSVNRFDPRWWWIIELNGEAEGAMLFTVCPDQGNIELVYLGISPRLRGRGLARELMRSGMRELAFNAKRVKGRERARMTCAVDLKNEPARRLYRGLGFQMTAERVAMVRSLG